MHPREGNLAPGGSCLLALQYQPSHVGAHQFPVFLRVQDGKRLHLQLNGCTVTPPERRLALAPTHRTLTLPPTPIGAAAAAPLHMQLIRAGAPGSAAFEVDLAPLEALRRDEWHAYDVLALASPRTGLVPEAGAAVLLWRFQPLEAKVRISSISRAPCPRPDPPLQPTRLTALSSARHLAPPRRCTR